MYQSGTTVDNRPVYAGTFKFVGSHGLPLEVVLHVLAERGGVVDWIDFIRDARADGWKDRTIRSRVLAAVADVFGPKYRSDFDVQFSKIIS